LVKLCISRLLFSHPSCKLVFDFRFLRLGALPSPAVLRAQHGGSDKLVIFGASRITIRRKGKHDLCKSDVV